jgi:hypothetical protein
MRKRCLRVCVKVGSLHVEKRNGQREMGGWKAGGNAGRCKGGVGCGDGRLHMVVLYNGAMEFKMTRTSIGLNDGSED